MGVLVDAASALVNVSPVNTGEIDLATIVCVIASFEVSGEADVLGVGADTDELKSLLVPGVVTKDLTADGVAVFGVRGQGLDVSGEGVVGVEGAANVGPCDGIVPGRLGELEHSGFLGSEDGGVREVFIANSPCPHGEGEVGELAGEVASHVSSEFSSSEGGVGLVERVGDGIDTGSFVGLAFVLSSEDTSDNVLGKLMGALESSLDGSPFFLSISALARQTSGGSNNHVGPVVPHKEVVTGTVDIGHIVVVGEASSSHDAAFAEVSGAGGGGEEEALASLHRGRGFNNALLLLFGKSTLPVGLESLDSSGDFTLAGLPLLVTSGVASGGEGSAKLGISVV